MIHLVSPFYEWFLHERKNHVKFVVAFLYKCNKSIVYCITQYSFYNFLGKSFPPESVSKGLTFIVALAMRKLKVKFVQVWQLCGVADCLISVIM